jgi:hypothetical protein
LSGIPCRQHYHVGRQVAILRLDTGYPGSAIRDLY